jgi:hypothetical protein
MPLVAYVPDPRRYDEIFLDQTGYGTLVRYRGSNLQNGSGFFPQILKNLFARFVRTAAPHAKAAFAAAAPHLKEAAGEVFKDTSKSIGDAISRRLAPQEGQGVKRKRRTLKPRRVKKLRRIPPRDIPDLF